MRINERGFETIGVAGIGNESLYRAVSRGLMGDEGDYMQLFKIGMMRAFNTRDGSTAHIPMDDPNITMYHEDVHASRPFEYRIQDIVFNDNLTSNETISYEPTVSSLNNNEIDFRISFDEYHDEDYMHSVSCIDDLDCFKDFENEFPAIVYNDALTSKLDFSTKPTFCPQHIDEFDLNDETSLSKYDEVEQNLNVNIVAWNYLVNGMLFNLIKNLYVPFGILFDPKWYYKDGDYARMLRRPSTDLDNFADMALPPIVLVTTKPVPVSQTENPPYPLDLGLT
ncbi:hypothetical protein Tco_1524052 [Tanacetum coccineum]